MRSCLAERYFLYPFEIRPLKETLRGADSLRVWMRGTRMSCPCSCASRSVFPSKLSSRLIVAFDTPAACRFSIYPVMTDGVREMSR